MTDNGLAALAAALQEADDSWNQMESTDGRWRDFIAAAILGERGVFLPDGAKVRRNAIMVEQDAEIARQAATIATLRADAYATIDLLANALSEIATLRAALDGLVEPLGEWLIEMMERNLTPAEATLYDALRAALATAKEAG